MGRKASVSVVIPTYCHPRFVVDAIHSVLRQEIGAVEIIVVNDGSPDDTHHVLSPFTASGSIKYIEQANRGQAAARNRGLAEATGEFVAFLDDDDVWPEDKLAWQVELLRGTPGAVVSYGQVEILNGGGERSPGVDAPSGDVFDSFVDKGWIKSPGQTLIRTSALKDMGGFDETIWGTDDWDLWLRLARAGEFLYCPRVALKYRYHAANASRQFARMYANGMKVVRKHFGHHPFSSQRRRAARFVQQWATADGLALARGLAASGDWPSTRKMWWQLAWMDPSLMLQRWFCIELLSTVAPRPVLGLRASVRLAAERSATRR